MAATLDTVSAQIAALHGDVTDIKGQLTTMNGRQRDDHDKLLQLEGKQKEDCARLDGKVNGLFKLETVISLVLSAVAGWLGWRD